MDEEMVLWEHRRIFNNSLQVCIRQEARRIVAASIYLDTSKAEKLRHALEWADGYVEIMTEEEHREERARQEEKEKEARREEMRRAREERQKKRREQQARQEGKEKGKSARERFKEKYRENYERMRKERFRKEQEKEQARGEKKSGYTREKMREEYERQKKEKERRERAGRTLSLKEALEIFDMAEDYDCETLKSRYRDLIKALHPDKKGSKYFTQKLNEAYDVLKKHKGCV